MSCEWELPVIISRGFSLVPDLVDLQRALDELGCCLPLDEIEADDDGAAYALIYGDGDPGELVRLIEASDKIRVDVDTLREMAEEVDG